MRKRGSVFENIISEIEEYIKLNKEYIKLTAVEKVSLLVSFFIFALAIITLGSSILFFLAFSLAHYLAPFVGGLSISLLISAGIPIFFILLLFIFKKQLIINPVVRITVSLFFDSKE